MSETLQERIVVLKNKYKNKMRDIRAQAEGCNKGYTGYKQAQYLGGELAKTREVYSDLCYLSDACQTKEDNK